MIRINLLPVRQVRKVQERRRQLILFASIIVVQIGAMFFIYDSKSSELDLKQQNISKVQKEIEALKQQVGDFDRLKTERDRLIKQRDVINSLHGGRIGPVAVLRELSDILSVGKGPTVDQKAYEGLLRRDANAGFNPRWNPRRLWLSKLDQNGKQISILGRAKDHDDVAELLKRLVLSKHFSNVQLQRNDQVVDKKQGLKLIRFSLTCKVNY